MLLTVCVNLNAQISIMPLFNFPLFTCSHYSNSNEKNLYFRKQIGGTGIIGSGNAGIFIKLLPLTSKINLYSGIYFGTLSWGYLIGRNEDNQMYSSSGILINHFPFFINIFDRKIGCVKKEATTDSIAIETDEMIRFYNKIKKKYSLRIKTYLGFSFDYLPRIDTSYSNLYDYSITYSNSSTTINYSEHVRRISNIGTSIMMGETMYIYNNVKHKETFSLSILYFQGLLNMAGIDVKYKIDNTNYVSKLFSRGSSIDLVLAYNININFKDKKLFEKKSKYDPHTKYPEF